MEEEVRWIKFGTGQYYATRKGSPFKRMLTYADGEIKGGLRIF